MILLIVYTLVFALIIWRMPLFRSGPVSSTVVAGLFLVKVLAGLALTWVYTHYYTDRSTADIFKYFDDARVMYDALWDKPEDYFRMLFGVDNDSEYFTKKYYLVMNHWFRVWETVVYNDNHTIIRWNAVVMLFSGGNFHVHTVFMCAFSFTGTWLMYKSLEKFVNASGKTLLLLGVFLFPSFLFWTSGVLKEGLLVFALGILIFMFFRSIERKLKWWEWLVVLSTVLFMIHLKSYTLIALVAAWAGYVLARQFRSGLKWVPFAAIYSLGIIAFILLPYVNADYHMGGIFKQKQDDFYRLASFMESGSMIHIPPLDGTYVNLLLNAIPAAFNGLLRPLPGESFSPLILMASLESLVIVCVLIGLMRRWKKLETHQQEMVLFMLGFVLVISILSGLVTPVLGALVRYRVLCFPFLWCMAVMVIPEKWIPKFLQSKR